MSHNVEVGVLDASAKLASLPGLKGNLKGSEMLCWSIQPLREHGSREPTPSHLLALAFGRIKLWVLKIRTPGPILGKGRVFLLDAPVLFVALVALRDQAAGCCSRLCCPSLGLRQETMSCCCQKTFGLLLSYQDLLSWVSLLGMETTQQTFLLGESEAKNN